VHYRPRTLIVTNLEHDHADIFPDLAAIQTQFHHLMRTVPGGGLVVAPTDDDAVNEVLSQGCWTPIERFGARHMRVQLHEQDSGRRWHAEHVSADGSSFEIHLDDNVLGTVSWELIGEHNVNNALAAVAAARHAGVPPPLAVDALSAFQGVTRRLDLIAEVGETLVYDDFAHHPTAIRSTLQGLRHRVGSEEIVAVVEPRTHTMSLGTLRHDLTTCCAPADQVLWFRGDNIKWDLSEVVQNCVVPARQFDDLERLMEALATLPPKRRHVVIMSNGSFGGIYGKLPDRLRQG
jgi:UDP-N-acetylmuramate: L-alanyl-gamma-D-glutamyl-meso-diaminopimelate ligase